MKSGLPTYLVQIQCDRCYRRVGIWTHYSSSSPDWSGLGRCRCDPPPKLPEGEELDALVRKAWMMIERDGLSQYTGRAPVKIRK